MQLNVVRDQRNFRLERVFIKISYSNIFILYTKHPNTIFYKYITDLFFAIYRL